MRISSKSESPEQTILFEVVGVRLTELCLHKTPNQYNLCYCSVYTTVLFTLLFCLHYCSVCTTVLFTLLFCLRYCSVQAFKFPDSMNVHFQCVVQVCRGACPEPNCGGGRVPLDQDSYGAPAGPAIDSYGAPAGPAIDSYGSPGGSPLSSYGGPTNRVDPRVPSSLGEYTSGTKIQKFAFSVL